MNKYFSRILKIFIFILIVVTLDQVLGSILRKYYFTQTSGPNQILTNTFKDCEADILIFGNSRAMYHYDTRLIKDSLKMSCFNVGQPGAVSIFVPYALFKVITNRYTPKVIIFEFNADYNGGLGSYDRLSILLPYYDEYPEIRPIILLRSPYEKIKLMSAIYPFNSNIVYIINHNINKAKVRKAYNEFDGFIPLKQEWHNIGTSEMKAELEKEAEIERDFFMKSHLDTNIVNALENITQMCQEKNIPLFIINSPIFHVINEKPIPFTPSEKLALDFINKNKVKYFDFSFDSTFKGHMELFIDRLHLNENGAKIFTNLVIDVLKKNYLSHTK
jgi:hypothetical protein